MEAVIYRADLKQGLHLEVILTTDHAASSCGVPVLVLAGQAYSPVDRLPLGVSAGAMVKKFLDGAETWGGEWCDRTPEALDLAGQFLGRPCRAGLCRSHAEAARGERAERSMP